MLIKPQYQTFDEVSDFNFPSSIRDIKSINISKKDKDGERQYSATESFSQIPDSFSNSFTRLKNLKVKLQNNDELRENYCRVSNDHESYGITEKVKSSSATERTENSLPTPSLRTDASISGVSKY